MRSPPTSPAPGPRAVSRKSWPSTTCRGWDEATKEITRKFATHGYSAICPNLFYREGPDASPDDAAAAARAAGGAPDERVVGDIDGARRFLLSLVNSNGKVGVIGYCSGGRQSYLSACRLPFDAAVDCYGAFVVGSSPEGFPVKMEPVVGLTGDLSSPLLGLFGAEDTAPSPKDVDALKWRSRSTTRPTSSTATRTWGTASSPPTEPCTGPKRPTVLAADLDLVRPLPGLLSRGSHVLLPDREDRHCRQRQRPRGLVPPNSATVYFDHPFHAPYEHTLNIDFVDNTAGPGARVAVELSAESARELVRCIESALEAAGSAADMA